MLLGVGDQGVIIVGAVPGATAAQGVGHGLAIDGGGVAGHRPPSIHSRQ